MGIRHVVFIVVLVGVQLAVMAHMTRPISTRPISLRLWYTAAVQFSPATVKFSVTVPPHPDNRLVRLDAMCGDVSMTNGEIQLNGEYAATTHWPVPWRLDEPCEYRIVARLRGVNDRKAQAETLVVVKGRE